MQDVTKFADPSVMKSLLAERLPLLCPGGWAITSCHVQHVRYTPKNKPENEHLGACYHLGIRHKDSQHEQRVLLYCKAFGNGRSQRELDNLARHNAGTAALPHMPHHFPDLDLLLWVFPQDPAILHLPEVSDPERVLQHFPYSSLPHGLEGAANIRSVKAEVINYRPELRCTTRYDLSWGTANQPQSLTIFGKTFRNQEGREIYARSKYLWNRYSDVNKNILFPQPLGYRSEVHTLWQLGIKGTPLSRVIEEHNCDVYLQTIAKGLAMVHTSDLSGLPQWTLNEHLAEFDKKIAKLRRAVPSLLDQLTLLTRLVHRDAPHPSDIHLRPTYWDFHIDQLLAQDAKVAFFDFDELVVGDPLQDIANFIVDLQFRDVGSSLAKQIAKSLYDSYRAQVMWEVPIDRVRWHARVQFLNKAYRVYIQQPPNVQETVRKIVHMAAQDTILDWIDDAKLIEGMSR